LLRCLADRVGRDEKGAPVIVCNHTRDRMSEIRGSIQHKEVRRSNTKGKEGKASNVNWGDDGGFKDVPGGEEGMISRSQSAGSIMHRPLLSGFPGRAGSGDSGSEAAAAAAGGGGEFGRTSSAGSGAGAHGGALEFGRTSSEASKSSERGGIERFGSAGSSKSGRRNQRVKGGGAGAEFERSSSAGSVRENATARSSGRSLNRVENRMDPGLFMSAKDDMELRLEKAGLSERAKAEMCAKEKVTAPALSPPI
jgi:hypothetical protein